MIPAERVKSVVGNYANKILLYLATVSILLLIYKFGFKKPPHLDNLLIGFFEISLVVFFVCFLLRLLFGRHVNYLSRKAISEYIILLLLFITISSRILFAEWIKLNLPLLAFLQWNIFVYISMILVFIIEISRYSLNYYTSNLNPARLFMYSFLALILAGTALLLLPTATVNGISVVDAFFTATSAVCVTGLVVLDTAKDFTFLGKLIILILIQAGGLGVMTFTSFFGFLFQGGFTFKNELFLQDILQEERMGEIFTTIIKILFITLGIEFVTAILIYFSVGADIFASSGDRLFFSVFHAVSAFCNAGFSTFSAGLYDSNLRFNYNFLLIISFAVIVGGLGFPIVFNYYRYLKHYLKNKWSQLVFGNKYHHSPRIINVNTRIVVYATVILLLLGAVLFYIAEFKTSLAEHNWSGKIVTAFFGSVTARTAGFNTVNMFYLTPATVLIYLLLMWIGASPGSTGGGIKTTTFSVALLSTLAIARGKTRLEVFRREITDESVKRSLSVIILSLLVIGSGIFLITVFDQEKSLMSVIFECFSAYSTVGLTLGITPELSTASKFVIVLIMFIGRVGALTVIIGMVQKVGSQNYKYPTESIYIT